MLSRELKMLLAVFIAGLFVFLIWNYLENKFLLDPTKDQYKIPEKVEILYKPEDLVVLFSRGKKGN